MVVGAVVDVLSPLGFQQVVQSQEWARTAGPVAWPASMNGLAHQRWALRRGQSAHDGLSTGDQAERSRPGHPHFSTSWFT